MADVKVVRASLWLAHDRPAQRLELEGLVRRDAQLAAGAVWRERDLRRPVHALYELGLFKAKDARLTLALSLSIFGATARRRGSKASRRVSSP
jgi:hypothetical protein